MNSKLDIQFTKPFGPMIAKVSIPTELVDKLNIYVDEIITNKKKLKNLIMDQN